MDNEDEWALDPSVLMMRQVFARMEAAQEKLLQHLSISPFDTRLKCWREAALKFFEKSCAQAKKYGIVLEEDKAAAIYVHCLTRAINADGIEVPLEAFPNDEKITILPKETLP
jgi:uncharacterized protein (DUF2336 family)